MEHRSPGHLEEGYLLDNSALTRQQLTSSASDSSYFTEGTSSIRRNDRAISTSLIEHPKSGIRQKLIRAVIPRAWKKREFKKPPVPLFYCLICLENHAMTDISIVQNCSASHEFCRSTIILYLESQLKSGIISFRCPHFGQCKGVFSDDELRGLLSEEDYAKYSRLKQVKTNPDFRECPNCTFCAIGSPTEPQILCSSCGTIYCCKPLLHSLIGTLMLSPSCRPSSNSDFHANAHPHISCEEYHRLDLQHSRKSVRFIRRNTRRCPRCHFDTEKDGGCNHMQCASCGEVRLAVCLSVRNISSALLCRFVLHH